MSGCLAAEGQRLLTELQRRLQRMHVALGSKLRSSPDGKAQRHEAVPNACTACSFSSGSRSVWGSAASRARSPRQTNWKPRSDDAALQQNRVGPRLLSLLLTSHSCLASRNVAHTTFSACLQLPYPHLLTSLVTAGAQRRAEGQLTQQAQLPPSRAWEQPAGAMDSNTRKEAPMPKLCAAGCGFFS